MQHCKLRAVRSRKGNWWDYRGPISIPRVQAPPDLHGNWIQFQVLIPHAVMAVYNINKTSRQFKIKHMQRYIVRAAGNYRLVADGHAACLRIDRDTKSTLCVIGHTWSFWIIYGTLSRSCKKWPYCWILRSIEEVCVTSWRAWCVIKDVQRPYSCQDYVFGHLYCIERSLLSGSSTFEIWISVVTWATAIFCQPLFWILLAKRYRFVIASIRSLNLMLVVSGSYCSCNIGSRHTLLAGRLHRDMLWIDIHICDHAGAIHLSTYGLDLGVTQYLCCKSGAAHNQDTSIP